VTYTTHVTRSVKGAALPLAYQASPKLYQSVTVAELALSGLQAGDLVHVSGTGQVQMPAGVPLTFRAMHCRYLKATKTASNAYDEGLLLAKPMGVNFTEAQHYSLQSAAGSFLVTAAVAGSVRLMLVMYAAGLSGVPDDPRSLSVKYVELRADVLKP
jgi:hypothetical protein